MEIVAHELAKIFTFFPHSMQKYVEKNIFYGA